jgi:hypothetical protein
LHTNDNKRFTVALLPSLDYQSQLLAIKEQLNRHLQEEELLNRRIEQLEQQAKYCDSEELAYIFSCDRDEHCHHAVYQNAAHSTAAIGMLAPFVESLFHQTFLNLRSWFDGSSLPDPQHARWQMRATLQWDCHYASDNPSRKDLLRGIAELSKVVGLAPFLHSNYHQVLQALFSYRNRILHCGLEWPEKERIKFDALIKREGWGDWFSLSTSANKPWVFCLTEQFILACLNEIERILSGIGEFAFSRISIRGEA